MMAIQAIGLVEFVAYLLAVFGISVTVSTLDGPFAVCSRLRRWVHAKFSKSSQQWLAKGIACPICVSFWVALPVDLLVFTGRGLRPVDLAVLWLSCVGLTAVISWLAPPADYGTNEEQAPSGLPGTAPGTPLPGGVLTEGRATWWLDGN